MLYPILLQDRLNGVGSSAQAQGEPDVDEMIQEAERLGNIGSGGNGMEDMDDDSLLPVRVLLHIGPVNSNS